MQRTFFHWTKCAGLATVCVLCAAGTAEACKYTVRDVAFVTLREAPYRLDVVLEDSANEDLVRRSQAAAELALSDVNVVVQAHAGAAADPAVGNVPDAAGDALNTAKGAPPRLLLTAPDERRLAIDWPDPSDGDQVNALRTACRQLVNSPAQLKLRDLLLAGHHSVIVLHEGAVAEHNRQARETVAGLIAEVKRALPSLPKPIDLPPQLLVVSQEQTADEKVFLWSLGIDPEQFEEAQLTIVFGRCRLLGPPMPVPGTTRPQILRRLAAVGQDCECELDRSVMRGQMVLHEWTAQEESTAASMLGFDPGNPLVQVEIQRILSRGPVGDRPPAESIDLAVDDLNLGGLQIIDIGSFGESEVEPEAESEEAPAIDAAERSLSDATTPADAEVATTTEQPMADQQSVSPSQTTSADDPVSAKRTVRPIALAMLLLVVGLAAAGVLGGAWIVARGRR